MDLLLSVVRQFASEAAVLDIKEHGTGNVNDTFLVTTDAPGRNKFILQRINTGVFSRPELIMHNLRKLLVHVSKRLKQDQHHAGREWKIPKIIKTTTGNDFFIDSKGSFWRAISFIENAVTYETVQSLAHAREAGLALGRFHCLINDLNPNDLYDTLEGFHITPQYLEQYERLVKKSPQSTTISPEIQYCFRSISERRGLVPVLENAKQAKYLQVRPIHGDPKISNIMLDKRTDHAVSIIDLDTVKPGLIHYDLGDCLRSCCNRAGEEAENLDDVNFDTDLCKAILEGYHSEARFFLTEYDYQYIYDAARLLPFELGLRFFTDYLAGNVYFKVSRTEHNLERALVQFRLTESIEGQEAAIRNIIKDLK